MLQRRPLILIKFHNSTIDFANWLSSSDMIFHSQVGNNKCPTAPKTVAVDINL